MKILVDENIPSRTVAELRRLGHDVRDLRGTQDQGIEDEVLWKQALREQRLLITTDKGFVHHRDKNHSGLIVVRLRQPNEVKIHDRVLQALNQFREGDWPGLILVMRDGVQSVSRIG